METGERTRRVVNPRTRIGHVHLKVANIERALGFYRDILGFEVTQWYGDDAVFLSSSGFWNPTTPSTEPQTTASPRLCTCRIPTATASSCTATVRRRSGRVPPKAGSQW